MNKETIEILKQKRLICDADMGVVSYTLKLKKALGNAIYAENPFKENREKRRGELVMVQPRDYEEARILFLRSHGDERRVYFLEEMANLAINETQLKITINYYAVLVEQLPTGKLQDEVASILDRLAVNLK